MGRIMPSNHCYLRFELGNGIHGRIWYTVAGVLSFFTKYNGCVADSRIACAFGAEATNALPVLTIYLVASVHLLLFHLCLLHTLRESAGNRTIRLPRRSGDRHFFWAKCAGSQVTGTLLRRNAHRCALKKCQSPFWAKCAGSQVTVTL